MKKYSLIVSSSTTAVATVVAVARITLPVEGLAWAFAKINFALAQFFRAGGKPILPFVKISLSIAEVIWLFGNTILSVAEPIFTYGKIVLANGKITFQRSKGPFLAQKVSFAHNPKPYPLNLKS